MGTSVKPLIRLFKVKYASSDAETEGNMARFEVFFNCFHVSLFVCGIRREVLPRVIDPLLLLTDTLVGGHASTVVSVFRWFDRLIYRMVVHSRAYTTTGERNLQRWAEKASRRHSGKNGSGFFVLF